MLLLRYFSGIAVPVIAIPILKKAAASTGYDRFHSFVGQRYRPIRQHFSCCTHTRTSVAEFSRFIMIGELKYTMAIVIAKFGVSFRTLTMVINQSRPTGGPININECNRESQKRALYVEFNQYEALPK